MDRLHDPAILALPHPIRVDAAFDGPIEAAVLHPFASAECLRPWFLDQPCKGGDMCPAASS